MNILQIHNLYQFKGGEDTVVEAERQLLLSNGHNVITLTAHNDDIKNYFKAKRKFYNELEDILHNYSIDIAHIHNVYQIIGSKIYELLKSKNIPIVQTIHNFRFLCPAGLFYNKGKICEKCKSGSFLHCALDRCYQNSYIKSAIMAYLVKLGRDSVTKSVDRFIVLNPFFKQKFVEAGFDDTKVVIKPNFIFDEFKSTINELSDRGSYALFLGRISQEKGVDLLIEVFKDINFKLVIAGTGDETYVEYLKLKAEGYQNIEFFGFASEKPKQILLQNASFLIVPSNWYENFPMTILEAFKSKKAVIASKVGGLPHLVIDNYNGKLFSNNNLSELKFAICDILDGSKYIEMGENAYEIFKEKYTEKQNYKTLIEIYNSIIRS